MTACLSDPGCVRPTNEDAARVAEEGSRVLAVVADGMGGHEAGEVAARLAVEAIWRGWTKQADPRESLLGSFRSAGEAIGRVVAAHPQLAGMGTTCTALAIQHGQAWLAHAGDSRAYLIRASAIYQLSEDHSMVMDQVRHGKLTREQARGHEDRNVLLRALGQAIRVEADAWEEPMAVRAGDRFVLCTDGLHDVVSDAEILATAALAPEAACAALVNLARTRGGHDNITVAIADAPPGDGA